MKADDIIKVVKSLESNGGTLHQLYNDIETGYFMEEERQGMKRPMMDEDDFKLTTSPSARNSVVGLVRLLVTNFPRWVATSESASQVTSRIEKLCEAIWIESCEAKTADVHTDLVRAAALYGECHGRGEPVADLLATAQDEEKDLLEELAPRTPALMSAMSPPEDWPYFGKHGLRGMLSKYMMTGDEIRSTWKKARDMDVTDSTEYEVHDWTDTKDRLVCLNGQWTNPLVEKAHGLKRMLLQVKLADGSTLWRKEERRRQPFLYALIKSGIWRRQTLVLSEIFTAINERGSGILVGFEEIPDKIEVNFAGPGVRFITAPKPKTLSDTAFDPEMVNLIKQVLDPLAEASTVFPQTLGSAADVSNAPFSSIALLSQSGQLPTVPVKKAVTNTMSKLMLDMLRYLKEHPPANFEKWGLKASEIPDDLKLEVLLEIKLPQDVFRNAQVAQSLVGEGLVTAEWARENMLQISDPDKMQEDVWEEQAARAHYEVLVKNSIDEAMRAMMPAPPTDGTVPPGETPGEAPPPVKGMPVLPDNAAATTAEPGMTEGVTTAGAPMGGGPGAGRVPASGPVAPRGTRPPRKRGY